MLLSNKLKSLLRITVGVVFIVGAISKLISIDSFEIYIYSFGILKLDLAFLLARFVISLELLLGILLIVGSRSKATIIASIGILLIFCVFIIFLILTDNRDHCHCFGDLNISHKSSLLKNVVLVVFLYLSSKNQGEKFKYEKHIFIMALIISMLTPFIVSPPDSWFYMENSKSLKYNDFKLEEYIRENSQFGEGKKILCFFSPGCNFCKLAARKISVIALKADSTDIVKYLFAGSEVSVSKFFNETNTLFFHYSFLPPKRFLEITDGEMPLIILLENGKVKGKYGYRDINEDEIIRFLSN